MSDEKIMALRSLMKSHGLDSEILDMEERQVTAILAKGGLSALVGKLSEKNPQIGTLEVVTLAQVMPVIKGHVESISNDFIRLRNILGRHEPTLQKRWLKKPKDQRKKLLVSAWPDMAQHHRPDLRLLWQEKDQAKWKDSKNRDLFMYPEINLEDLTKAKPLLLMLDSRSRHKPAAFANHDWNTKGLGRECNVIKQAILCGWIMLLRDDAYGSLRPYNEESWHTLKNGLSYVPGMGILILETQQRLMRFLVNCSELILHDLPLDADKLHGAQLLPSLATNTALVQPDDVDLRPSLETIVQEAPLLTLGGGEAPYRTPLQFDFARLQNVVFARRAEAEDHLWALREDPSYFTEIIQREAEYLDEVVRAEDGLPDSWSYPRDSLLWEEIIRNVIHIAYTEVTKFADMWFQIRKIVEIGKKLGTKIKSTEPLPREYYTAIVFLEVQVKEAINGVGEGLKSAICASSQLRNYFIQTPEFPRGDSQSMRAVPRNISPDEYFLWVIAQLVAPEHLGLADNDALLYELQRMMQADSKQKQRLTASVVGLISSLSVVFEVRRQINLLVPGPNGPNAKECSVSPEALGEDAQKRNHDVRFQGISLKAYEDGAFAKLCLPLSKFKHPSDKRQTATITEEMRKAEANLDNFWAGVDHYFVDKTGETLNGLVKDKITVRDLNRTAPWVDAEAVSSEKRAKTKGKGTDEMDVSILETTLQERTERTILRENVPLAKTKVKTRGKAIEPVADTPEQERPPPVEDDVQPLFHLDKRAYKVFSSLFRISTKDGVPGELPWSDFAHAMVSIGFAVQSLDGSAWIFSPADGSFGRSIIFHEPHPMSKIPYLIAKRVGRRLNRAFGWTSENFTRE